MNTPSIKALYTCHGCGLVDHPVEVAEREFGESPHRFMQRVAREIGRDHRATHPSCNATTVDIMVPNGNGLGRADRH